MNITYNLFHQKKLLDRKSMLSLVLTTEIDYLCKLADKVRQQFMGNSFHLCSIINARSGNCTQNCRFCAQSARYHTGIDTYGVIDKKQAMAMAAENNSHGVHRLSLVTSGRRPDDKTLTKIEPLYKEVRETTSLDLCASMGLLDRDKLEKIKSMGVSRYHCNLESCRSFFPTVCTSHSWLDKVNTLKKAKELGMSICSGGIIGMGESMAERMEMALELRELEVKSIPVNILTPIPGTPLTDQKPISLNEVLRSVAMFRLINPEAVIIMAGGRQQLGRKQYQCFSAGANGALVGNYLTTVGSSVKKDLKEISALGFSFER
jgi:biotin synthase